MAAPAAAATAAPAFTLNWTYMRPKPDVLAYLAVNTILGVILVPVVIGRILSRLRFGAGLGWDDFLVLAAVPLAVGMLIIQGMWSTMGSSYDVVEAYANLNLILVLTFTFQLLIVVALGLVKASMVCFYLRVFRGAWMKWTSLVCLAFIAVWSAAFFFGIIFICSPVAGSWDRTLPNIQCGDQIKLLKGLVTSNILVDLMVMSLPIYTVWNLQMRLTDKLGVIACFLIAIVITIASIFRLVYVSTIDIIGNLTQTMSISAFLGAFEPLLAIICVSLPMLRPFYINYRKGQQGSANTPSRADNYGTNGMMKLSNSRDVEDGTAKSQTRVTTRNRPGTNDVELDEMSDGPAEKADSKENLTSAAPGITVSKKWEVQVV